MGNFANSEYLDEMSQNFSFNQYLHYLPRQIQYPGTQGLLYKGLRIFTICSKTVVGQCNCWFLVCKWSVMKKQVTSSYKWLPVFTLLTINLDMPLYSHES